MFQSKENVQQQLAHAQEQYSLQLINAQGKAVQQPVRHWLCEGNYTNGPSFHCRAGLAQFSCNVAIWRHEISFNWMHPALQKQHSSCQPLKMITSYEEQKQNIKERLLGALIQPRHHLHWNNPNPCCFGACQTGFVVISVCQGPGLARDDSGVVYQPETQWSKG